MPFLPVLPSDESLSWWPLSSQPHVQALLIPSVGCAYWLPNHFFTSRYTNCISEEWSHPIATEGKFPLHNSFLREGCVFHTLEDYWDRLAHSILCFYIDVAQSQSGINPLSGSIPCPLFLIYRCILWCLVIISLLTLECEILIDSSMLPLWIILSWAFNLLFTPLTSYLAHLITFTWVA